MKNLIEFNGFWFSENTPQKVMEIISNNYHKNRIRVFYGFTESNERTTNENLGLCWNDEYDTIGLIGRSTGKHKIPLLIKTKNSHGGGAILDDAIIKITIDKKTVYQHSNFHLPFMEVKENSCFENGILCATFKTNIQAQNFLLFKKGERNSK